MNYPEDILRDIFMQDFNKKNNKKRKINFQEFSKEEKQNLLGAFTWLIEQDKKQNPERYKLTLVKK